MVNGISTILETNLTCFCENSNMLACYKLPLTIFYELYACDKPWQWRNRNRSGFIQIFPFVFQRWRWVTDDSRTPLNHCKITVTFYNVFFSTLALMKLQKEYSEVFSVPQIPAVFPGSSCHCTAWAPGTSGLLLSVTEKTNRKLYYKLFQQTLQTPKIH